jgi:hypothetical protein
MLQIVRDLKGSEFVPANFVAEVRDTDNHNTANVVSHTLCVIIENFYREDFAHFALPFLVHLALIAHPTRPTVSQRR